ncbi:hypothetical protein [Neobacillus massiliamazoniensis]|uniref:Uncharacterized protein n=1 Tax=Neobacillus massiliamazoniensis TaxID=1499688 RepID=A0A0U1NZ31_9BACI|nr:hypothetical protein [Neobacillus massiliamazoniensis]CRK83243.1 hypothetical protein BN000_03203 [Neobacillus massiliamazoniensis]
MLEKNDWRLTNQESSLIGAQLYLKKFISRSKDHEHCVFCLRKIMDDNSKDDLYREAYTTQDEQHWVCKYCFIDFKDMFKWK